MRKLVLLFLIVFVQASTAQIRWNDLPFYTNPIIIHDDSVSREICIDENTNTYWVDSVYRLTNNSYEFPEKGIINQRSFLISDSNKYMLDSLIIKNYYDYELSLDIVRVYINKRENREYLIIECCNTYQNGSESQPIFLIFTKEDNHYSHQSVYIMDNYSEEAYDKICILYDNDEVIMEGDGISLISF